MQTQCSKWRVVCLANQLDALRSHWREVGVRCSATVKLLGASHAASHGAPKSWLSKKRRNSSHCSGIHPIPFLTRRSVWGLGFKLCECSTASCYSRPQQSCQDKVSLQYPEDRSWRALISESSVAGSGPFFRLAQGNATADGGLMLRKDPGLHHTSTRHRCQLQSWSATDWLVTGIFSSSWILFFTFSRSKGQGLWPWLQPRVHHGCACHWQWRLPFPTTRYRLRNWYPALGKTWLCVHLAYPQDDTRQEELRTQPGLLVSVKVVDSMWRLPARSYSTHADFSGGMHQPAVNWRQSLQALVNVLNSTMEAWLQQVRRKTQLNRLDRTLSVVLKILSLGLYYRRTFSGSKTPWR